MALRFPVISHGAEYVGYYYRKKSILDGLQAPEIYTLPAEFIRQHHRSSPSGWEKVMTKGLDLKPYSGETGFELIANELGIVYPGMPLVDPFDGDVTAQLNEVYAEEDSSLDSDVMALQVASIGDEQW